MFANLLDWHMTRARLVVLASVSLYSHVLNTLELKMFGRFANLLRITVILTIIIRLPIYTLCPKQRPLFIFQITLLNIN